MWRIFIVIGPIINKSKVKEFKFVFVTTANSLVGAGLRLATSVKFIHLFSQSLFYHMASIYIYKS